MAIAAFHKYATGVNSATSQTTLGLTFNATELHVLGVWQITGSGTANLPTVTSSGRTWTQIATKLSGDNLSRMTFFRSCGSPTGTGEAVTIDCGGQTQTYLRNYFTHFTGMDTSGTNGSGAIVQSASNTNSGSQSSITVTLSAFGDSNNMAMGFASKSGNNGFTEGSGFTVLGRDNANPQGCTEYKTNDTTVDWTWTAESLSTIAMAIEVKVAPSYVRASGGTTITTSGSYTIHKFTSSGTFTPDATLSSVDYLVVGGGGGGGYDRGGGGGSGAMLEATSYSVTPSTVLTVTVGGAGSGGTGYSHPADGGTSVFGAISAVGGGVGGYGNSAGQDGGSGGGGSQGNGGGTAQTGGNIGGGSLNSAPYGAGGGGGAGAVGAAGTAAGGGDGGAGSSSSITGSAVTYAAGGGGAYDFFSGSYHAGVGGSSIGGNAGTTAGSNGTAGAVNTGSGGGGGANNPQGNGGAGGTGIVIVRYLTSASSVKTFNGLAKASVKTVYGLAVASVKNINGLA